MYAAGAGFWLVCVAVAVSLARPGGAVGGVREDLWGVSCCRVCEVGECAAELGGSRGLELGECVCYLSFRFACFGGFGLGVQLAVCRRACL